MPALDQPAYDQHTSTPTPVQGNDMSALWHILAQAMAQQGQGQAGSDAIQHERNQIKSGALFGRHLGMGGAEMTAENPSGDSGLAVNPWGENGLFHGGFHGVSPRVNDKTGFAPGLSNAEGAVAASPQPQVSPFHNPTPLTGPQGNAATDQANLQQNQALYAPGGFRPPPPKAPAINNGSRNVMLGSPRPGFSFGWPQ